MSVPVALDRLRREIDAFGPQAYVLTSGSDGRPHAVLSTLAWEGDRLVLDAGRRTAGNAAARAPVALLWPPVEPGGYSLIVDGDAAAADGRLLVEPTKAVLHRPGPPAAASAASGCTSDCVRVA